jgi:hypothetical protein
MDTSPLKIAAARARLEQAQRAHQAAIARIAAFYTSPEWLAAAAEERRTAAELAAAQRTLAHAESGNPDGSTSAGG